MYVALLPYRRTVDARKQQRGAAEGIVANSIGRHNSRRAKDLRIRPACSTVLFFQACEVNAWAASVNCLMAPQLRRIT
jgi:hypothetical protein